jgi:hypothetical protein
MPPWVGLEWACKDLSYEARQLITLDHQDQTWRWSGKYYFYRDIFTDAISGQQVQLPQVLQFEDPGVEDPVYIQGAVRQGQCSAVPAW